MRYKNMGRSKKVFRGVEFNPGDTKEVDGYVNDPKMIRIDEVENVKKQASKKVQSIPNPQASSKSEVTQ